MKRITLIYAWLFCLALSVAAQEKVVKLKKLLSLQFYNPSGMERESGPDILVC